MASSARQRRGAAAQIGKGAKRKRSANQARNEEVTLLEGDCLEVLASLEAESIDAIITDPPYGIGFKSARWDSGAIRETAARTGEDGLSPTQAFEVWATLWATECARVLKPGAFLLAFGSPRTFHRLARGIEDSGLEIRDTLMWLYGEGMSKSRHYPGGRATTLKPAFEPIILARRELDGTTKETISRHGTGALNAGACRVQDRHPANVILEHDPECGEAGCVPGCTATAVDACVEQGRTHTSSRIAPSRFLYCPKARRGERDAGCERLPQRTLDLFPNGVISRDARNPHPCVKPLELMRWLVRLACPPGGVVLDPTCGSGSTGAASVLEGRRFVGIELERAYLEISAARIAHWAPRGVPTPRIRRAPLGRRR
jgi:DNA modification methylase